MISLTNIHEMVINFDTKFWKYVKPYHLDLFDLSIDFINIQHNYILLLTGTKDI